MLVLVRIVAPHFVAGLVAKDGRVIKAAPILRYMIGWDGRRVGLVCDRNNWQWERYTINEGTEDDQAKAR